MNPEIYIHHRQSPVEFDVNAAMNITQPTLVIGARRSGPPPNQHEGSYPYPCPLGLGDKCRRNFKNCAQVKYV